MKKWLPAFLILVVFAIGSGWLVLRPTSAPTPIVPQVEQEPVETPEPPSIHVPLPEEVRGIYWTAQTARTDRADELLSYMQESGLNAVVIDLKMDDGSLAFVEGAFDDVLARLKDVGIYRIARIAVMRDSAYAVEHPDRAMHTRGGGLWRDNTGAAWLDPASPEVAQYAIDLGREAYAAGFDEIQYDYVRFASDGALSAIVYSVFDPATQTKEGVMQTFFKTVGGTMQAEGIPVSFDVFGMTYESSDDFNIGQRLADVFPHADFISPMVYPSHYADGFQGFANPAEHPYAVVTHSLESGLSILQATFGLPEEDLRPRTRPWLQDFDIGAVYTAALIEAQIQAARDAGASGWLLWNARNVYEPANYLP